MSCPVRRSRLRSTYDKESTMRHKGPDWSLPHALVHSPVFKLRQGFVKSRLTTEAEASAEQIPRLLQLRPNAVLVGRQALAVWANALNIVPTGPLDPYVTSDVDFLGSRSVAKELAEKLHVDLLVPSADDHVQVNSAILVLKDKRGS